jgi:hypothetical protein
MEITTSITWIVMILIATLWHNVYYCIRNYCLCAFHLIMTEHPPYISIQTVNVLLYIFCYCNICVAGRLSIEELIEKVISPCS